MWSIASVPCSWFKLSQLVPERVLDEIDGPVLFTARSDERHLLLAYRCAMHGKISRFLLVPITDRLVRDVEADRISLRDALTRQAVTCMVDQSSDGFLSGLVQIDYDDLPASALPREGVYLNPLPLMPSKKAS